MYSIKIDYNVPRFGGDCGLLVTRSNEGTIYVDNSYISALYSYGDSSEDFVLSFGLPTGITNRVINYKKVVFNDNVESTPGIAVGQLGAFGRCVPMTNSILIQALAPTLW